MKKNPTSWLLGGGFVAAIGASLCCAGPFVLLLLGASGSWISTLTAFEPYRPYFIVIATGLYLWAGWKLHRPVEDCADNSLCSIPSSRKRYQVIFWCLSLVGLAFILSPYWLVLFA